MYHFGFIVDNLHRDVLFCGSIMFFIYHFFLLLLPFEVGRVLGLRSTTDPLFQIEKVFDKVKYMDTTADGAEIDLDTFFQATEDWNSAMTISNSMAFISQFGEYNPGGGKDEVLKYLNESKKAVVQAQASLKKIMDALGLPELTTTTAA